MELKVGDTVRLKSGGPLMTIQWCNAEECKCQWFDDKHKLQVGAFKVEQVEKDD